jgi:hypothetical protein
LGPVLDRAPIPQRLMRAFVVVPLDPLSNDSLRLLKRLKGLLPDTLFFETPKEPFNDPVLLWGAGCNESLLQPIVATGLPKPPALANEPVVATENRCSRWSECPVADDAGRFDRSLRLFGPTAQREFVADHLPIMTVDHRREMRAQPS